MKKRQLEQGENAEISLSFSHNLSEKLDAFIRSGAAKEPVLAKGCLIMALGGYGRRRLAPSSDIDLLVYSESPFSRGQLAAIARMSAWSWPDGRRLSLLTHDADSLAAQISTEVTFLTSLMDRRVILGPAALGRQLDRVIKAELTKRGPVALIDAKLAEQDTRHHAQGDNRFFLQPDVKEGKGGLRDLHTLRWIGQFLLDDGATAALIKAGILKPAEAKKLDAAEAFFNQVRLHLHRLAGRAQDRLSFEWQASVASAMGYKDADPTVRAERFMRDYFRMTQDTGHLTRILCTALEDRALAGGGVTSGRRTPAVRENLDGFALHGNRLDLPDDAALKKHPAEILRLFRVAQMHAVDIHPDSFRRLRILLPRLTPLLRTSDTAHLIFWDILCDGRRNAQTLRRMNESGVLTALFEDFANIHAHMQYDMYHTFTTDEHTIHACALLHDISTGKLVDKAPLATALFPTLAMPRLLFLAMFLHDMAKGSGHDHAKAGAQIARKLVPRFGLADGEADMLAWLVENHLLMTATAFKRDMADDKTIDDFVAIVQSPERLKMLEIMTVADIMAVGAEVWNNWKGELLRQLYQRSYARLTGSEAKSFVTDQDVGLWFDRQKPLPQISIQRDAAGDFTRVMIAGHDTPGLFALLAGAIAAAGATIVQARIDTLPDGVALDTFDVQDVRGQSYENEKFLHKTLRTALEGKLDIAADLVARRQQRRLRPARATTQVIIDNTASHQHTLVEVQAPDRPGLLYDITQSLSAEGLNIHAAKVATFGRQAADVFYVKDAFGLKILHPDRLASLEKALMITLAQEQPSDL